MKCARCNAEIKVGNMYCPVCGKEAQIVSDDQLLEEEYLNHLLKEKKQQKPPVPQTSASRGKEGSRRKKNKRYWLLGIGTVAAVAAIIIFSIGYRNHHSFAYQYNRGAAYLKEEDYGKALKYMTRALNLDNTSLKTRLRLAEIYQGLKQTQEAIDILKEAIELDRNYENAYKLLISIYEEQRNFEAIAALEQYPTTESIRSLLSGYISQPPVIVEKEGVYDEFISVSIKAEEGSKIYYTIDGSSPKEKGILYTEAIPLKEGDNQIKAIVQNEYGVFSEERDGFFIVELKKPDMPKVNPDSGSFSTKQSITIDVPAGCKAYYSWDGSVPDESSAEYRYPLQVPEGNNILSVILISEHGLKSDVLKCNYIYLPDEGVSQTDE